MDWSSHKTVKLELKGKTACILVCLWQSKVPAQANVELEVEFLVCVVTSEMQKFPWLSPNDCSLLTFSPPDCPLRIVAKQALRFMLQPLRCFHSARALPTHSSTMVKALICGGGNGAHVMAGIAAAQPDTEARVITLFADEAERWTANMAAGGFSIDVHSGSSVKTLTAKPSLVTKKPEEAMPGIQVILFAVPAFAHEQYLNALKPYVQPGTILVGIPGQAGFEFAVRGIWGDLAKKCTIMSFESLPWACRIKEFGKSAEVLGTKGTLLGAVQLGSPPPPADPTGMVQSVLGEFPKLITSGHLLGITLMATNGYLHPSIMYGRWKDWDGKPLDDNPLFYNGLDEPSAKVLSSASDEVVATAKAIMQQRNQVSL